MNELPFIIIAIAILLNCDDQSRKDVNRWFRKQRRVFNLITRNL